MVRIRSSRDQNHIWSGIENERGYALRSREYQVNGDPWRHNLLIGDQLVGDGGESANHFPHEFNHCRSKQLRASCSCARLRRPKFRKPDLWHCTSICHVESAALSQPGTDVQW